MTTIEGWIFYDVSGEGDFREWMNTPDSEGVAADVLLTMADIPELAQRVTAMHNGYFYFAPEGGAGTYRLRVVVPEGYSATTSTEILVAWHGEAVRNVCFGLRQATGGCT